MTDQPTKEKKSVRVKGSSAINGCADASGVQLFRYSKGELSEAVGPGSFEVKKLSEEGSVHWLNVCGLKDETFITSLCKSLKIHRLTIEDILDGRQRPKFQEFDEYNFFSLKSILPTKYPEIDSEQISFILGKNYLITLHDKKVDFFENVRTNLRDSNGIVRERGADYLLYEMLEAILDNYYQTLQLLEEDIDRFDMNYQSLDPSPVLLKKLEQYRRHVNMIKRTIFPIKEFTMVIERGQNKLIEKKHLKYYFELNYLCLTIIDTCDAIESDLESHINLFFSVQGYKMNDVMKTLTMVATIFIPLTFIAGVYGMNFPNMPEIHFKYGYLSFWIVIIFCLVGMIFFIRKKRWVSRRKGDET